MMTNVDKTVELFNEATEVNPYLYFELAYTRQTGWMCWLQDRTGGNANKKNLVSPGQAEEPGVACVPVKQFLEAWKRNGWEPVNPPPLVANTDHPFDGHWKTGESNMLDNVCDVIQDAKEEADNPKSVEEHLMEEPTFKFKSGSDVPPLSDFILYTNEQAKKLFPTATSRFEEQRQPSNGALYIKVGGIGQNRWRFAIGKDGRLHLVNSVFHGQKREWGVFSTAYTWSGTNWELAWWVPGDHPYKAKPPTEQDA